MLLCGGFLLWLPTVFPEVGAGGYGGRIHDWVSWMSRRRGRIVTDDEYPWFLRDLALYAFAWILIVLGTSAGILAAFR